MIGGSFLDFFFRRDGFLFVEIIIVTEMIVFWRLQVVMIVAKGSNI